MFWQDGFPAIASVTVSRQTLVKSLEGMDPVFLDLDGLKNPDALASVDLLVLPYGSAVPTDAWRSIHAYLEAGGNLLVLGGQPLRVPVSAFGGKFIQSLPQDTYSRELDFRHSYEVPVQSGAVFAWRSGYSFLHAPQIRARRFFAVEGHLNGLGYMLNSDGLEVAAPVIVSDNGGQAGRFSGSRIVALDFDPEPGYWDSPDGISLISQAAEYARQGATSFWLEMLFSTLKPGEYPQIVVHVHNTHRERLGRRTHWRRESRTAVGRYSRGHRSSILLWQQNRRRSLFEKSSASGFLYRARHL